MTASVPTSLPWYRSTLIVALVGSLFLWAALPPLALGWLGWLAPVPWLLLVRGETLPGRRPYRSLYFAGFAFWLAAIHWLRLPHPLVYFGWLALSAYLACYLPVFVGLSRVAVHRLGVPLWLAAPVVWTGLELARAHVMTGFMMGSLAHTQVEWPAVIQIADLFGEYSVDFLIVLVAAGVAQTALIGIEVRQGDKETRRPGDSSTISFSLSPPLLVSLSLLPAIVALAAALAYGRLRLSVEGPPPDGLTVRLALIQGNNLADWKQDPARQRQIMEEYLHLSNDAIAKARAQGDGRPADLVVWPETMFRVPLMSFDPGYQLPVKASVTKEALSAAAPRELARLVAAIGTPVLVGIDRIHYLPSDSTAPDKQRFEAYNSAVLVDRKGQLVGTYDKVHLVVFGEYVPFARWLPFLKGLSSLTGSVEAGAGPVALCVDGVCYAPNICYETVMPHVIRRQMTTLHDAGTPADVLVNLTNDAWYWGSSELEQHLACGVFRAIETRRPLVIAANGGISAWIDHLGRVRAQSPKQMPDVILADVELNRTLSETFYMRTGDWFAGVCLACCLALTIIGWKSRPFLNKTRRQGDTETRRG
ncbi:MAG: apolipoprotein N-acyltransferase [Pirellulales bacterium]